MTWLSIIFSKRLRLLKKTCNPRTLVVSLNILGTTRLVVPQRQPAQLGDSGRFPGMERAAPFFLFFFFLSSGRDTNPDRVDCVGCLASTKTRWFPFFGSLDNLNEYDGFVHLTCSASAIVGHNLKNIFLISNGQMASRQANPQAFPMKDEINNP